MSFSDFERQPTANPPETVVFLIELFINMYGHWFWDFWMSGKKYKYTHAHVKTQARMPSQHLLSTFSVRAHANNHRYSPLHLCVGWNIFDFVIVMTSIVSLG